MKILEKKKFRVLAVLTGITLLSIACSGNDDETDTSIVSVSGSLDEQLDYERDTQRVLLDREEFKEGVTAFLGKRKPNFRDIK